jgi:UDP-GlcNAc:undecaprenyl-phosphate GlcNAc-1-phosphate transferase
MGGSLVSKVRRSEAKTHVAGVSLQGDRQWDVVWLPLVEFAEKNGLWQLKLDLNLPWQHEGYHGYWARGSMPDRAEQWSVKLPIICLRRSVGRLVVIGHAGGQSQLESLEAFSYLIAEMQPEIERLVDSLAPAHQDQPQPAVPQPAFLKSLKDEPSGLQVLGAK